MSCIQNKWGVCWYMYKLSPHNDCLYDYTIATGKDYTSVLADLGYMQASITVHLLEWLLYYLLKAQLRAPLSPCKEPGPVSEWDFRRWFDNHSGMLHFPFLFNVQCWFNVPWLEEFVGWSLTWRVKAQRYGRAGIDWAGVLHGAIAVHGVRECRVCICTDVCVVVLASL